MDRLDAMQVFVAVVEAGSLSGGGRRLAMPLATVSRKLSDLETHLRARLLNRSTRKLELTAEGNLYLDACRRVLEDIGEAERVVAGEYSAPRGQLILTAPVVFGRLHVLPVVTEFLEAFQEVDVRLLLGDRVVHILDEHIDAAVRIGNLKDSSFIASTLGSMRQSVCGSPAYLSSRGLPKHPSDLVAHQCVTFNALGESSRWVFDVAGVSLPVQVHSRLVVNTAEAAVDAAKAGVGLTRLLSYQAYEARQAGDLMVVLSDYEGPEIPVSLVFNGQQRIAVKLRAFLDFATPRLRERLRKLGAT